VIECPRSAAMLVLRRSPEQRCLTACLQQSKSHVIGFAEASPRPRIFPVTTSVGWRSMYRWSLPQLFGRRSAARQRRPRDRKSCSTNWLARISGRLVQGRIENNLEGRLYLKRGGSWGSWRQNELPHRFCETFVLVAVGHRVRPRLHFVAGVAQSDGKTPVNIIEVIGVPPSQKLANAAMQDICQGPAFECSTDLAKALAEDSSWCRFRDNV
jgi:hypothetical protein